MSDWKKRFVLRIVSKLLRNDTNAKMRANSQLVDVDEHNLPDKKKQLVEVAGQLAKKAR